MRLPFPETLLTVLLAAGFVALGETILRRRSRDILGANDALLVGMGTSAAALFPLTLVWPRRALLAEAILLGAALVWAIGSRVARPPREPLLRRGPADPVTRLILAAVALIAVGFAALNFRYTFLWDGMLIWATKAQLLFHSGGLTREWFAGDVYDLRHLAYPNLVPLCEALLGLISGGFDFDAVKPIFLLFYLSLLAGAYGMVRGRLSSRAAAVAALLVCLVPALSTSYATGAYADMPQAAIVAAVTAAALGGRRDSLPWLIGALTTVKSEGMIFAGLACAAVVLFWFLESGRRIGLRVATEARGIAIVAAFLLLRVAYVRWIPAPHEVYSGTLSSALARVPLVARHCLRELMDWNQWGLFWPALLLAAAALLAGGRGRDRVLAAAVVCGLVLLTVPFLFTTWPVELQISQAYSRLASQLAPAAAAVLVIAYGTLRVRLARDPVLR